MEHEYRKWQDTHSDRHLNDEYAGSKRAASKNSISSAPKRVKTEDASADGVTDAEMKKMFKTDTVSHLTVAKLRAWLGEQGEKGLSGMKKPELINRVEQIFESRMDVD